MQPNFENLKRTFYNSIVHSSKFEFAILFENIQKMNFRSFHKKRKEIENEFKLWLNTFDIRCCGQLITAIDELNSNLYKLPTWMSKFDFYIDYNESGDLDLIKKQI